MESLRILSSTRLNCFLFGPKPNFGTLDADINFMIGGPNGWSGLAKTFHIYTKHGAKSCQSKTAH